VVGASVGSGVVVGASVGSGVVVGASVGSGVVVGASVGSGVVVADNELTVVTVSTMFFCSHHNTVTTSGKITT
jgi:hypothetical protein